MENGQYHLHEKITLYKNTLVILTKTKDFIFYEKTGGNLYCYRDICVLILFFSIEN